MKPEMQLTAGCFSVHEKRDLVAIGLQQNPELSDRSIADKLGVDDRTVASVRRELESTAEISAVSHRVGLDGRRRSRRARHSSPTIRKQESSAEPKLFAHSLQHYFPGSAEKQRAGGTSVLNQVRIGFSRSPLAFLIGMIFGGFVSVATWALMHLETLTPWHTAMICGGAIFSAVTVFEWARAVFRSPLRALSFALLVESAMLLAETRLISITELLLLVVINSASSAVCLLREDNLAEASTAVRKHSELLGFTRRKSPA